MRRKKYIISLILIFISGFVFTSYHLCNINTVPKTEADNIVQKGVQEVVPPQLPAQIKFAGEEVPLDIIDVYENLDRELLVNVYFHSQTIRFIKLTPRYFEIIEPILKRNGIPDDFKYLALAESGFNPKAISPAGATGIWQLMKGTAKDYGLEVTDEVDERYNIEKATEAACKYLNESFSLFGNWTTVAASYNVGRNGIEKEVERQKEKHYYNLLLNEETSRYVYRIVALKVIIESPEKYGFVIKNSDFYPKFNLKTIEINTPVSNFADFAKKHDISYKVLKMFNPWLRESYLTNKTGKTYQIKIPSGKYKIY